MFNLKIEQLKEKMDLEKKDALDVKQAQEVFQSGLTFQKIEIEDNHLSEFNEFNKNWDKKMNQFFAHSTLMRLELDSKHETECDQMRKKMGKNMGEHPKWSSEILNFKRIQNQLSNQKE